MKNHHLLGLFVAVGLLLFPQGALADHQRNCIDGPTPEPIDYGEVVRCAISPVGDTDLFIFEGREGELTPIQVTGGGSGIRPCFRLFGPDFRLVGQVCGADNVARGEFRIGKPTGGPGMYTVEVFEQGDDRTLRRRAKIT